MTEDDIEYHMFRWPAVIRRQMADPEADPWMRTFVRSIARHGKRSTWTPSPKQEAIMRRLVNELAHPDQQLGDVVDREDRAGAA